jgi:hypothetical protein
MATYEEGVERVLTHACMLRARQENASLDFLVELPHLRSM